MEPRQVEIRIPERNVITDKGTVEVPPKTVLAVFHCWEQHTDGENFSRVYAIIETEDGKVDRYDIDRIRFTGNPIGANLFENGIPEE